MNLEWEWHRTGMRGSLGYTIKATNQEDKTIESVMDLSNKLDKVIKNEIEDRIKFKEEIERKKKEQRKAKRAAKIVTQPTTA